MWVCESISPGITVAAERSITWAPAGVAKPASTRRIRSAAIRIETRSRTVVEVPSISRPA